MNPYESSKAIDAASDGGASSRSAWLNVVMIVSSILAAFGTICCLLAALLELV